MAVNYASGLSDYPHKGKCGAPEVWKNVKIWNNISRMVVITIFSVGTVELVGNTAISFRIYNFNSLF